MVVLGAVSDEIVEVLTAPPQGTRAVPTLSLKPTGYETYGLALGKMVLRIFRVPFVSGDFL